MALSIDGNAHGSATAASTVAATLTSPGTGDIIVVIASAEWPSGIGSSGIVSGVSGGGLTFVKRGAVSGLVQGFSGTTYNTIEVWWAYAAAPLVAVALTATFTKPGGNNFDGASVVAFGVTGFTGTNYITNPWDGNVSLPATGQYSSRSVPTINISTTTTAGMSIGAVCSCADGNTYTSGGVGSGYTFVDAGFANASTNYNNTGVEEQVFSSAQSVVAVNWTPTSYWLMIADALTLTGGAPASTARPQLIVA